LLEDPEAKDIGCLGIPLARIPMPMKYRRAMVDHWCDNRLHGLAATQ
jgi:hypothetical protein